MDPDYGLYLVTDSTPAILGGRDLGDVVEQAIRGGVTIVQYRQKDVDTRELLETASKLHNITKKHGVPLIINDRVDVALTIGAEGVHLGQEDMHISAARKILGPDAIIGVTASSVQEALQAAKDGADYLGLGTVFATPTKPNSKSVCGVTGLRRMLESLSTTELSGKRPKTVCIGGINESNLQRVLYQSRVMLPNEQSYALTGVAVVSAIVGSPDPAAAAEKLRSLVETPPAFASLHAADLAVHRPLEQVVQSAPQLHQTLAASKPLSHNMTNTVVQNIAANIALAIGASPIMSQNGDEAADLAAIPAAGLVINMGTVTAESLANYTKAIQAYNKRGRPILLDPVGAGATALRKSATRTLLNTGYFALVKGNEAEIRTVWAQGAGNHILGDPPRTGDDEIAQRGVDSGASALSAEQAARLVRDLARRERNVVLMTGATDYLSDGGRTLAVDNGHPLLGDITGSGCSLGTTVLSFLAVDGFDTSKPGSPAATEYLGAALAGLLLYEIAAERAAALDSVRGPGTFVPAFIDELHAIREESASGNFAWIQAARVREVSVA